MHIHINEEQSLGAAIINGIQRVAAMRPTYCLKWAGIFRKAVSAAGAKNGDVHATYAGMCAYFIDLDGQAYRVTVEPCKTSEYRE